MKQYAVGVDFGGTNVKLALVNAQGKIVAREKFVTREAASQAAWMDAVATAIEKMLAAKKLKKSALAGIGVGVPGFVDFERGLIHDLTNVPGWTAVSLASKLQKKLRLPCYVDNDANLMALGEIAFGGGKNLRHAVFLTLGTGVGGGLVLNGQLYRGAYSMAGELGHVSIDLHGVVSPQGRGGLEQYVGNRRIVEYAVKLLKTGRTSKVEELCGGNYEKITPELLASAAQQGDAFAQEVFDYVADCLAAALASVTYLLQPQAFIIGGGVAASGKILFGPLRKHLAERLSPHFAKHLKVLPAKLGNDAGAVGGATLALTSQ
ncbi:MAG: ROK family protein [Verrucomicrobia bacterium]|nr:MAG: ROK family protein [Verrucomicrobiota bacterium]